MTDRNAVMVLPEPVGEDMRVDLRSSIRGIADACGAVNESNRERNHRSTTGSMRSMTSSRVDRSSTYRTPVTYPS